MSMPDLLATKISLPLSARAATTRVERSRLTRLIDEDLRAGRRLLLVSAPAGFGKTICVLSWLEHRPAPAAWFSIDAGDDDPLRFFRYLIAAISSRSQGFCRELESLLRAGQLPPPGVIAAALVNELQGFPEEITLVLDDFHHLQDAVILGVMEELIVNLPATLALVLVTREDPPFSLARLRANGLLAEIRAADLRFNAAEARSFLVDGLQIKLSPSEIETLEERTEGWAAGLQLAGLSLRGQSDPSAFIAALSGSQRFILNYLVEEVLNRQPDDIRAFLLQTSILDRFNGSLCDAVTGRADSREVLKRLYQANLFLVTLDEKEEWFRYHHLFGDLLRDQLSAASGSEMVALHARAGRWFNNAGQPMEAIDHFLAAGDYPSVVQLLEKNAIALLFQGQFGRVEAFLRAVPTAFRGQNLRACLAFAWVYLLRGSIEKTMFYFQQVHDAVAEAEKNKSELPAAVQAEWLALQAMFASGQGRAADGLAMANRALELAPRDGAYVLTLVHLSLAGACRQMGDYTSAVQAYHEIIRNGRLAGNVDTEFMGYAGLSQILLNRGLYRAGYEIASQGIARMEEANWLPPISAALYGSLAEVYWEWNQPEKALASYRRAARLSSLCGYSDGEICLQAILSQQCMASGDLDGAEKEIQQGLDLMKRSPPAWVREVALARQVQVKLAAGKPAEAMAAYKEMSPSTGQGFSLPVLPSGQRLTPESGYIYLTALRLLIYHAEKPGQRARLSEGLAFAAALISAARQDEFVMVAIETLLLQARMHLLRGENTAARNDLIQALEMGEKEGFLRVFMDSDPPVRKAMAGIKPDELPAGPGADYISKVLEAVGGAGQAGQDAERGQPTSLLSERECEVLRLMSRGLTYDEIARELVISLNTVRSHVKSVYGKLNTNNRTQAIASARDRGLLDA